MKMNGTALAKKVTSVIVVVLGYSMCVGAVDARTMTEPRVAGTSYTGKEFLFGVLDYMGSGDTKKHWDVQLDVGAKIGGHFSIYYAAKKSNQSYYIGPNGHVTVAMDVKVTDGTYVGRNSIQITSNTDLSVLVTASDLYSPNHYASSYVIYPLSVSWSNFYFVASYTPVNYINYASRAMIIAESDNTKVNITNGAEIMAAVLDRMDVFQYDAPNYTDLTGWKIHSDHPVVVLSGSSFSLLPGTNTVPSPVATQMLPTGSDRFIVPPIATKGLLFVRILTQWPCNVTILNKTSTFTYTLKPGNQTYALGTEPTSILTSWSIWLIMYSSPFMTPIPGVKQYLNEYSFVVPFHSRVINTYKLVAIVPSDGASGLLLDGAVFTGTTEHIMSVDDDYTIITGNVTKGFHFMVNVDPTVKFGLLLYDDLVGFFVGMNV